MRIKRGVFFNLQLVWMFPISTGRKFPFWARKWQRSLTLQQSLAYRLNHIFFYCVYTMCRIKLISPYWFEHLNKCYIKKSFFHFKFETSKDKNVRVFSVRSFSNISNDSFLCSEPRFLRYINGLKRKSKQREHLTVLHLIVSFSRLYRMQILYTKLCARALMEYSIN